MTAEDFTATLPRKRIAAGLLLTHPGDGRILLVEPTYKPVWEIPGGTVEAGESPHAAVVREVTEELGLTARPGPLLVTDWLPPRPDRTEGLMLIFDGGALTPADTEGIRLPPDELRSWAWCTEAEATERLAGVLARRVRAAVGARSAGTAAYLENGYPVP